jgi:signal transduction histidine kinase
MAAMDFGSMSNQTISDMDVLVLAPFGKDSVLIENVLQQSGVQVRVANTALDLVAVIPDRAGAAIVAEEALAEEHMPELARKLEAQPTWSDFPMIVLTGGGVSTAATEFAVRARAPLGNVTLLERPLRAATMISAVRSALSARRRQYEIRNHLQERERAEQALRSARDALESIVEERTAALRRLSAQLLRVQDDERRRIARELHDSLGQYLAAAKINLDTMALSRDDVDDCFREVQGIIDRAISETRTLSHLLHPPLLDATGFASAASWYVQGYAKRSGIEASLQLPDDLGRLSVTVETALFRIMQEALTNVHRHSGSPRVDITLTADERTAALTVRDYGKGIPEPVLSGFRKSGINVGVGLAGIRERVKELGGSFEIQGSGGGTTLKVSIPVGERGRNVFAGPPSSQIYSSFAT